MNKKKKIKIAIIAIAIVATIYIASSVLKSNNDIQTPHTQTAVTDNVNEGAEEITLTKTSVTITTLDKWYEFNTSVQGCHYFSNGCYDILRMIILGQSNFKEFETVKLSSWQITRDMEKYDETTLEFSFTVAESALDTLPAGNYTALIHDNAVCELEFVGIDPRETGINSPSSGAYAVCDYINATHSWSVPIFGKNLVGTQNDLADYIIRRYGEDNKILFSTFEKLLFEKFGIKADENEIKSVIIDNRLYVETQVHHTESYAEFSIIGDETTDSKTTVTVVFYADPSRFIKTDTVEYYIDKDERFLGCKRTHIGDYDPFEVYNTFKQ